MGTIAHFDLLQLTERHGLLYFVETGTGRGDSLAFATESAVNFVALRSCEVHPDLYHQAASRFAANSRVHVSRDRSDVFLWNICTLLPRHDSILFWLDAHFPGADYGFAGYNTETDQTVRLPLASELAIIAKCRPEGSDVILVDDARIYLDAPWQHGNLPPLLRSVCPQERNIDFVHDLMRDTHDIEINYAHEGYIVLTPKGSS